MRHLGSDVPENAPRRCATRSAVGERLQPARAGRRSARQRLHAQTGARFPKPSRGSRELHACCRAGGGGENGAPTGQDAWCARCWRCVRAAPGLVVHPSGRLAGESARCALVRSSTPCRAAVEVGLQRVLSSCGLWGLHVLSCVRAQAAGAAALQEPAREQGGTCGGLSAPRLR
ncbi:hypothetical protein ACFPM0_14075 [Pseudonocardia sulfidoxydans]|uniref:hypothetical protein n=1 Tax=Pseudonocardia sulfidoxydans TaxID=54011 RepID=UPI00361130CE